MSRKAVGAALCVAGIMLAGVSSVSANLVETFPYPDGDLSGNGPPPGGSVWGGSSSGVITVVSQQAKILAAAGSQYSSTHATPAVAAGPGGKLLVEFDLTMGGTTAEFIWAMLVQDPSDNNFFFFQGFGNSIRPRSNVSPVILANGALTGTHEIRIEIDTVADQSTFYFDNQLWGDAFGGGSVLGHTGAGSSIGPVRLRSENRGAGDASVLNGDFVLIDNLTVSPEPASLMLLALGAIPLLRRRRA